MPQNTASPPNVIRSYCRFTASPSSGSVDATATLRPAGIEIDLERDLTRRLWQYANLEALEPLRPNTIDVLLSTTDEPGARLFVQGREFAAGLKEQAPHLTARAESWRGARPWLFLFLALLVGFSIVTYAAGWSPIRSLAIALPDGWRQRLGDAARQSMTEGHKQCSDPAGLAALAQLTDRVSKAASVSTPFRVRVYDWSLMNAFAVPGGQIVLTKGLIDKAETADEVAGVLAHEMGHGIELHPETGIIRSIGLAAAVEVMLGGSGGALANAGLVLAQLDYSRGAERQADQRALELLEGASIAPKGLADFFTRVMKMEEDDGSYAAKAGKIGWLRSHPPAAERAEIIRHQHDYPSTPALDAQAWQDLKSICRTTLEPDKGDGDS